MSKSVSMMEKDFKQVDAAIYVLDARAPHSCLNPEIDRIIGKKPIVFALNKADLGEATRLDGWIKALTRENRVAVKTVAASAAGCAAVLAAIKTLCKSKIEKYAAKGAAITVRAMTVGVPNTGKSTLINALCRGAKTRTGDKAGVTRGKQWVRVNDCLEILDTPGTLYPKLSDEAVARRLAYMGSIRDEVVDTVELAEFFLRELFSYEANILKERYRIEGDDGSLLEKVARARGYVVRGGTLDTDRAAGAVLDDFRKGRLGKITLEKAEDYDFSTF